MLQPPNEDPNAAHDNDDGDDEGSSVRFVCVRYDSGAVGSCLP